MAVQDPQAIWSDYYERKKQQRADEAASMWKQMEAAGVNSETVLALDFVHFGTSLEKVQALANQLSENYSMSVVAEQEPGYWSAKGTTRPYGIELSQEQHLSWVDFMCDVAHSYGCVFSTWSLEATSLGTQFLSEGIESAS